MSNTEMEIKTLENYDRDSPITSSCTGTVSTVWDRRKSRWMIQKKVELKNEENGPFPLELKASMALGDFLSLGMQKIPWVCGAEQWFYDECNEVVYLFYPHLDCDLFDLSVKVEKISERVKIARQLWPNLVQGLVFLAQAGIYHYDIKPENIGIKVNGGKYEAYYLDFGMSQHLPCLSEGYNANCFVTRGTKCYCAIDFFAQAFTKETPFYSLYLSLYSFLFVDCPDDGFPLLNFRAGYSDYESTSGDQSILSQEDIDFLDYLTTLHLAAPVDRIPKEIPIPSILIRSPRYVTKNYYQQWHEKNPQLFILDFGYSWLKIITQMEIPFYHDYLLMIDCLCRLAGKRKLSLIDPEMVARLIKTLNWADERKTTNVYQILQMSQELDFYFYHPDQGTAFFTLAHLSADEIRKTLHEKILRDPDFDFMINPLPLIEKEFEGKHCRDKCWYDPRKIGLQNQSYFSGSYLENIADWPYFRQD